nr:hypothetical protein [uncultured Allomuricauda sp.]
MKKLLFPILLILVHHLMMSQKSNPITVTLNTTTRQISESDLLKIPFDEEFTIVGTFDNTKITRAELKYRIKGYRKIDDDCKKHNNPKGEPYYYSRCKHYYVTRQHPDPTTGYVTKSVNIINEGKGFSISMDPLHPNEVYELLFQFYSLIQINVETQNTIKEEIYLEIDNQISFDQTIEDPAHLMVELNKSIDDIIKKKIRAPKFMDESGVEISKFNPISDKYPRIASLFADMTEKNNSVFNMIKNNLNYSKPRMEEGNLISSSLVYKYIEEIEKNKQILNDGFKKLISDKKFKTILDKPVNPILDEKIRVKDILTLLITDINRAEYQIPKYNPNFEITNSPIFEILIGRAKINENIDSNDKMHIVKAENYHLKSGQLLKFGLIELSEIKDSNQDYIIDKKYMEELINVVIDWTMEVRSFQEKLNELNDLKTEGSDLIQNLYSTVEIPVTLPTKINIESTESPYFGLDVGIMLAPKISSTFFFEGFNFHFKPVNRKSDFSSFSTTDQFWKRTSIFFGLAQRIGNYDDNYEKLIGVGSPFVGVGWRIHKGIRVNGGVLIYEIGNNNPLITKNSVKATGMVSVSLDAKFKDIIKLIAGIK